jgi:hypothetical protein
MMGKKMRERIENKRMQLLLQMYPHCSSLALGDSLK